MAGSGWLVGWLAGRLAGWVKLILNEGSLIIYTLLYIIYSDRVQEKIKIVQDFNFGGK